MTAPATPEQIIAKTLGGKNAVSHARRILSRLKAAGYEIRPLPIGKANL